MKQRVAIIGGGSVGSALALGLHRAGHGVVVGVRDPADPKYAALGASVPLVAPVAAAEGADVVVLAVPVDALATTVPALGLRAGQIVVDATNAVRTPVPEGFSTVGAFVASLVPAGVPVVKAFDTIGAEHLATGSVGGRPAFLPVAGDDQGRAVVVALAADLGFAVADLGGPEAVALVEAHAALWIHLAFRAGWGRDFGFVAVRP